MISAEKESFG